MLKGAGSSVSYVINSRSFVVLSGQKEGEMFVCFLIHCKHPGLSEANGSVGSLQSKASNVSS